MEEFQRMTTLFTETIVHANTRYQEILDEVNGDENQAELIFKNEIDQRKINYESPSLGNAELTNIDDIPVVRMIDKMGTVVLYVNSDYITKDSPHLKLYIDRQHHVAGKNGRNLILVWHDSTHKVLSSEKYAKPKKLSLNYWRSYLSSVYKPATFDSFCMGILSGLAQAALTGVMGIVQHGFDPHVAILSASVFGFGSFIGTYASTYRNFVFFSESKFSQIFKQSLVSLTFAHMVFSLNQIHLGNSAHVETMMDSVNLLLNVLLSSYAKNEFSQWAKIQDIERADIKTYTQKVPLTKKAFSFTDRDLNYQFKVQLTTQGIRTADLLGYRFSIPTPDGGVFNVELGKLLLWLSAPVVNLSVKKWANNNYPETAKKLGLDKAFGSATKENLKKFFQQFKVLNPLGWSGNLEQSYIDAQIKEINESYFNSMTKTFTRSNVDNNQDFEGALKVFAPRVGEPVLCRKVFN
jgi:hypothetical protein